MKGGLDSVRAVFVELHEGRLGIEEFCRCVENMWNFEMDEKRVPEELRLQLESLFDEVVWFSPFPREEWGYPAYRDEIEIRDAAVPGMRMMGILP